MSTLEEVTRDYTGREWLLPGIAEWLNDRLAQKFLIVTGPPGAGKTALCAWLCGAGPTPDAAVMKDLVRIRTSWTSFHFCSHRLEGASVDPRFFIRRVAMQFASAVPEYGRAALRILSAPTVQVNMSVGTNLGKVVGVRTDHLWVTGHSIADGFSEAIKAPVELMASENPHLKFALLVDGLDEALSVGGTSIAHLVASMADLPDNIKILVSTKKDRRVRDLFPDQAQTISLGDVSAREYNRRDILGYIRRRTSRVSSQSIFEGEWAPEQLADAAAENFQYARHLLDEIESGTRPRGRRSLPASLPLLYRSYLDRLIPSVGEYGGGAEVLSEYLPLLELLSVSFAPISLNTAANIIERPVSHVITRADELQQLIDFGQRAEPALRFFHSSMADFITVPILPDQSPNPYYAAPYEAHIKVARSYLTRFGRGDNRRSWDSCDIYGLTYLVEHIREALFGGIGVITPEALYELATDTDYRKAQMAIGSSDAMLRTASATLDYAINVMNISALRSLIDSFAIATEPQLRGLGAAALARIYPQTGKDEILRLLRSNIPSMRQVGLNAAYQLGFGASDLFQAMALARNTDLPRMAAHIAYLKWSLGEHEIVMQFADEIAAGVRLWSMRDARARLSFLGDASVILYINLVHDRRLIYWGDNFWWNLLIHKLHVHKLNRGVVSTLLISAAFSTMSQRLGEAVMVDALQSPDAYFRGGDEPRRLLSRTIDMLDPKADLRREYDLLAELLGSDIAFLRVIGSIVLSSHFNRSPATLEPFLRERFVNLSSRARLWHLIAFGMLAPTSSDWHSFVAWQTAYILKHDRATVASHDEGALQTLNFMLLPLGFACGKANAPMTEVEDALRLAVESEDHALTFALIEGLGMVGLYYPAQALGALDAGIERLEQIPDEQLIEALATMSVLHPQVVDVFLEENGRSDLQVNIHARANVAETRRFIDQVGFFSAAIYQAACIPIMRERITKPALRCLTESYSVREFARKYTKILLRLLREYDYHMGAWIVEDASAAEES